MSKPRTQKGYIFGANNAWHLRFYVHEDGIRKQRSRVLCPKNDIHPTAEAPSVVALAESFVAKINEANGINDAQQGHSCPVCGNRCKRTIEQKFAPKVNNP